MRTCGIAPTVVSFAVNILLLIIAEPAIGWMFREALRAGGMMVVDFDSFALSKRVVISAALPLVIAAVCFVLVALQTAIVMLVIAQTATTRSVNGLSLRHALRPVISKLSKPSAWPLFAYLLILPLSGFGFSSVLTQTIAVPHFVSGELLKDPFLAVIWHVLMLALLWANLKLSLTVPLFVQTSATGTEAMRMSWQAMRVRPLLFGRGGGS